MAHAEQVAVRRLDDEVSRALVLGAFEPPPLDPPAGSWDDGSAEELEPGEGSEALDAMLEHAFTTWGLPGRAPLARCCSGDVLVR